MDDIIKTTAKFQEAQQPPKQKPIIQIERANMPAALTSSIDGGRDNPFRPDGEIYKSANPIVDYYKFGLNHSRNQSPTSSQPDRSLIEGQPAIVEGKELPPKTTRRSCCQRWLCCR